MRLKSSVSILSSLFLSAQLIACQQGGSSAADAAPAGANPDTKTCSMTLAHKSYFEEVQSTTALKDPSEPKAVRERSVKVDIAAMKTDLLAGASSLYLDLFNDKSIQVKVDRIQKKSKDQIVMTGRIADDPLSSVSLAIENNVVISNIHATSGNNYNIIYRGQGVHDIQENSSVEPEEENENSCLAIPAPEAALQESSINDSQSTEQKALAATPVIDMLVAYTPAALANAGSVDAIKATIETGIADTNTAFQGSGVNLSVRLVGIMALKQDETTDYSADLVALKGKTDGRWDEVHAERERLGADQVTVVGNYPNNSVWGIGYTSAGATSAFTTVKLYAFRIFTLSHELGHNIGLQHSDGYVNTSGNFRTIMAYGSQPRIRRYSNPSLAYNGFQTGTSSNNSVSILNANASRFANLVASKVPSTTVDVPVTPTPSTPSNPSAPGAGCEN
jgi:hypothetical protein